MPSFLSKVFARKKEEKESSRPTKRSSAASLLEGKFEAVSPNVSPSATHFPDTALHGNGKVKEKEKDKDKSGGFSLLKTRTRPVSPNVDASKPAANTPHLTLNLPVPKEEKSRALGVVFEADPEDRSLLSDNVVGERQLSPLEALFLVKTCSSAIVNRGGLETLGVMHPHWYSASPETQRRLISLFILSLAPKSPITTLSPTPTSPSTIFNTELEYARSPHDIASVLRWALRHLHLEGDSFTGGSSTDQWQWYYSFADAERSSSYPDNAFSQILVPKLPPAHLQLLVATLEIVSSLAAHSERNGISGSKLSKILGLWMLAAHRTESEDDWATFYARWERAGRIFEHVFLAQIRDEMMRKKMPLRLSELVAGYPYSKNDQTEDSLLPRPRLSTRRYDAIYVRVEAKLPDFTTLKPKPHPLRVVADAMRLEANLQIGEHVDMWNTIRQAASARDGSSEGTDENGQAYLTLSKVFADDTIRLLSLIPAANADYVPSPTDLASPLRATFSRPVRRRSTSLNSAQNGKLGQNGFGGSRAATSSDNLVPKDWQDFSSTGFGESALGKDFAKTLLDNDLEVTQPPSVSHKTSKRRKTSPTPSRRSSIKGPAALPPTLPLNCTRIDLIQLDEAFFDFWSDALLDPISSSFPSFVVCQLKPLPGVEANGKAITWLVLEQTFSRPPPPPEPMPASPPIPRRPSSPRPSVRSNMSSRKSSTFSAARKRFTFFSSTQTIPGTLDSKVPAKNAAKSGRVGEMGEILPEVPEGKIGHLHTDQPNIEDPTDESHKTDAVAAVAAISMASDFDMAHAAQIKTSDLPPVPVVDAEPRDNGVPVSIKTEELASDKPCISVPQDITVPTDPPTVNENTGDVSESKPLPPAPEPVVLAGDTPGPQIALSTSEPAALAEASQDAALSTQSADTDVPAPSTVLEISESTSSSSNPLDKIGGALTSEPITASGPESEATKVSSTAVLQAEHNAITPVSEVEVVSQATVTNAPAQYDATVPDEHEKVDHEEQPSMEAESGTTEPEHIVVRDAMPETHISPIIDDSSTEATTPKVEQTFVQIPAAAESHEEEVVVDGVPSTSPDEQDEAVEGDREESSVPQEENSEGAIYEPATALGEEAGQTVAQVSEDEVEITN
ncbi:uncharacterized protein FIBRA_00829 [Fibroporia radiculosa]|uniref:Meiotically up-regulated protein Msb1/Mug8 domain-containing protein n=1 Tax=Fibroporia radiculosa TaxID=599839 RepID=J4H0R8_9APHY|nr:uncharacterized protein FIBRA_00829 [Fibroporia radiculosa]CCL98824.1 predicted protein [Fibroporia radiculosa]